MRNRLCVLGCALLLAAPFAMAAPTIVQPYAAAQTKNAPDEINMVVEIPAGSFTKYEINEEGLVYVDRFQSMPVVYPANYGSITRSLAGDNDPLDAMVFTREPLPPGVLIKVRPIGYLKMMDDGEADEKIIAVPATKIDPTYDAIQDINDLPEIERQRIEAFFNVYKQLPAGRKKVELSGFGNAAEAKALIKTSLDNYVEPK
ncbi:inorganic diphosphatase [Pseudomonas sp. Marseille-QA0892]